MYGNVLQSFEDPMIKMEGRIEKTEGFCMVYEKIIYGKSVDMYSATMADLEFTYEIRQDRDRTKYMHPVNAGLEGQKRWLENQMKTPGDYFFVVKNHAGKRIGTCSVYSIDADKRTGEIGRNILNGNPIENFEALVMIHEVAFFKLSLARVYARILRENLPSIGVTMRMGGQEAGHIYDPGLQTDILLYEITKENYMQKRDSLLGLCERYGKRNNI